MKFFLKKKWLFSAILLAAFFLRFAGISWGLPYPFHPDEWNMANAVAQLSLVDKLNPHFFAYGQLPLYLAYFSAWLYNHLLPWTNLSEVGANEAIFFLRFWSAFAGGGTVYLVFLISKRLLNTRCTLLATLLAAFTPGLIQVAHFGTTESLLSFFFLATVYFSLNILEKPNWKNFFTAAVFLGLALGTKISALVFCVPLLLATPLTFLKQKTMKEKLKTLAFLILSLALALALALVVSPYLVLNFPESKRILLYETQVATGQIPVFYTRQFPQTTPILFQIQKIFPYALGWPVFILGMIGLFLLIFSIVKNLFKQKLSFQFLIPYSLFLISFLIYFFSQTFLFTKWTRFMAPIFAFFPIFAAFFLSYLSNLKIKVVLIGIALLPGIAFSSIYLRPDIRFQASEWIYKNIPSGAKVLSETGNVIDIPFSWEKLSVPVNYNLRPVSFDFYHLDEDPRLFSQLLSLLESSDYIFVPSRRLFANHLRLPEKYPLTAKYYELLFSGKLGFTEVKIFYPFPQFLSSDESAEETWSVFDHPIIRIYKKETQPTRAEYQQLFLNN